MPYDVIRGRVNCFRPSDVSVNWIVTGQGNGLSPVWCQAINWTNTDFKFTLTFKYKIQWNINQNIHTLFFKKMHWKMLTAKWQRERLSLSAFFGDRGYWGPYSAKWQLLCFNFNVLNVKNITKYKQTSFFTISLLHKCTQHVTYKNYQGPLLLTEFR